LPNDDTFLERLLHSGRYHPCIQVALVTVAVVIGAVEIVYQATLAVARNVHALGP
jgi:hypothetical protein